MKKTLLSLLLLTLLSCTSYKEIGQLNVISNRNFDTSKDYQLLATYSGDSDKEIKKSKSPNIQTAIDDRLKNVPGGEYLTNVKIYLVDGKYYSVTGDVFGTTNAPFKGFVVGDVVMYYHNGLFRKNEYKMAVVKSLKSQTHCLIMLEDDQKVIEVEYEQISKAN